MEDAIVKFLETNKSTLCELGKKDSIALVKHILNLSTNTEVLNKLDDEQYLQLKASMGKVLDDLGRTSEQRMKIATALIGVIVNLVVKV